MSRLRFIPIVVAAGAATPALAGLTLEVITGSANLDVVTICLIVIGAAIWITYINGRRANRVIRRVARLETAVLVDPLDTGSLSRPVGLRRVR